ncbi:13176_t:CDS:1, partial [Racocetra persica]
MPSSENPSPYENLIKFLQENIKFLNREKRRLEKRLQINKVNEADFKPKFEEFQNVIKDRKSILDESGKPSLEELTFLGVADVSQFIVSGLEIPISKIMVNTILTIWVQGVRESNGEYEKWKKCSIPLFYYTTK